MPGDMSCIRFLSDILLIPGGPVRLKPDEGIIQAVSVILTDIVIQHKVWLEPPVIHILTRIPVLWWTA